MKEQCHLDKEVSSEPGEVLQSLKGSSYHYFNIFDYALII